MRKLQILCGLFLSMSIIGAKTDAQEVSSRPLLAAKSNLPAKAGFTTVSAQESGLDFQNLLKKENIRNYLDKGAGGCVGDFDSDGLPDLYLISQDGPNRLMRQTTAWQFEDITNAAGDLSGDEAMGTGATAIDIDNDGDLDIYLCNQGSPNMLFLNQGNGSFIESAKEWGLDYSGGSVMASFCDYDRDGDLDCYLLTYRIFELAEDFPDLKVRYLDGDTPSVHPDMLEEYEFIEGRLHELGRRDLLLRNTGDGRFENVTGGSGISTKPNHGLSAVWWDHNNDNWPDLYVANDFKGPDHLWQNNGDGTFTDVLPEMVTYTSWFSMGSDFADINRDGWFDYATADMSAMNHYRQKMEMGEMGRSAWFLNWAEPRQFMRNTVFVNTGSGRFLEAGFQSNLESTGWTWATRFADLDCDGWEDAIFTNGIARDVNNSDYIVELNKIRGEGKADELIEKMKTYDKAGDDHNKVFRNRGDLTFEDVSEAWGYNDLTASFGLILADLDRDGDLDAVTNNMNQPAGIYRNDTTSGNRVLIELRGIQSNSFGVGSRLRLHSASGSQTRLLSLARGYQSGSEPILHFGLGEDEVIDQLEIDWPSGAKQVISGLAVNQHHVITEPDQATLPAPAQGKAIRRNTLFSSDTIPGFKFEHEEDSFDDYEEQPLLPWGLSRLGPGIAFGDADADGDEDLWIGGATGQNGRIIERNETGGWTSIPWGPWEADSDSEDMGALFFDPDKDGDLDLYVASGGNQETSDDSQPVLEDRLYLNIESTDDDKTARGFAKADPDPNPENRAWESSGVVAAADYDKDGDIDIFVGSRTVAGKIHEMPRHRFLRNEGDRIADVIDEVSPALRDCGMVTGALFSDVDGDGRLDLLVTTAWGPVRLFKQSESGTLEEATTAAGLSEAHGWWQGIDGGDFDGDGDFDFIVTNLGLNTKYHASAEHPILVYLNDFDGNGTFDLVESEFEGDTLYPMRGRSCSSQAMPFISKKFKTFHDYASAELTSIYTELQLDEARVLKFTHLESSVLLNDGSGTFEIVPLPPLAQIAPGFGVAVEDFDGDGLLDAVLAQNFYSPQPETGRMSGGLSLFLKGNGDGSFDEVWPKDSGIAIHEDAKSLAIGDLNDDGAPDLVIGINNGGVRTLVNQTRGPATRWSRIELSGVPGNPTGIGATLRISTTKGRMLKREIRAGSSYLSQSTPQQFIALARDEYVTQVDVTWPKGTKESYPFTAFSTQLELNESE
ncbi:FG-GAP-like repeat-containing protein [Verrucomicrobiales bacterium BCK34]|nr:FG-GAP-like repeat-containing protein [Verrucomicrobiales bacterium BCK34]